MRYSFPGLPLDLNTATRAELIRLPGIGGKTADRIIEERGRRGGFREVTDLLDIEWLGDSRLSRLRGLVHIKVTGSPRTRGTAGVAHPLSLQ
jgi:competence protein ComEA